MSLTVCVCSLARLCPDLCDPMDCSPPGSSVHGILQATILEWVVISSFKGFSQPRDQTSRFCLFVCLPPSHLARTGKPQMSLNPTLTKSTLPVHCLLSKAWATKLHPCLWACVLVTQSSPTLCDHMDCSPPGSSVHGILQARILEPVAIPFSRGSFQPRD